MNKPQLLAGFAVKVLLGLLYGYIFLHSYGGDDTWKFFNLSLKETEVLLNNPTLFFTNEFTPWNALRTGNNTIDVIEIYLNDLQYVLVVKSMAIFNLVSRGNYYVNVVFFNAIVFFGHYWLYLLMTKLFPSKKQFYYLLIFFFLPAVFWLSGIRVDGLLFFFVSLKLYYLAGKNENSVGRWIMVAVAILGVIICRPQIALLLMLAALVYLIASRTGGATRAAIWVYGVAILMFLLPVTGLTRMLAERQQQFMRLEGTKFQLDALDATPFSYLKVLPQAVANTFIRPFPWEAKSFLQLMASAEVLLFWIIIIVSLTRRHAYWKIRLQQPLIVSLLFFGMSAYIFTGMLVPFPGALIRYKAIPELLILCAVVSLSRFGEQTNYKKL